MKKILLSLSLVVAAVFATHASNCFTFSVGDTLLVNPATIYDNVTVPIDASFCGRVDQWEITFTCSTGVHVRNYMRGYSMIVPFINRLGQDTTLWAPLNTSVVSSTVTSRIEEIGYFDPSGNGGYVPYGTVKWCDSVYVGNVPHDTFFPDMLDVEFQFDYGFSTGTVTISGSILSGQDSRQCIVTPNPASFSKTLTIIVGYMRGDADGDGEVDVDDVTAIIGYLQDPDGSDWNQYNIAAADVNGDGRISIGDVTALVAILLSNGTDSEELNDIQSLVTNLQMNGGQGACYAPYSQSSIGELTTMPQRAVDQNYYNLMGQPVGTELPTTPGIYIHQGKKIAVR